MTEIELLINILLPTMKCLSHVICSVCGDYVILFSYLFGPLKSLKMFFF